MPITRRRVLTATALAAFIVRSGGGAKGSSMQHVVLLGDSVFDNAAYVRGGPDVVVQLRSALPAGWGATLAAVDGATTSGVARQIGSMPADASHLVVSAGGNDALGYAGVLSETARSVAEAMDRLAGIRDRFRADYHTMLRSIEATGLPAALCTIYDPRFDDPLQQRVSATALAIFNDVITREAVVRGMPLVDLRVMFNDPGDYANPIEPSVQGGEKIAAAITRLVSEHDFSRRRSEVFAGAT